MMRVRVEIHPHGVSECKRTIAEIDIANMSDLRELSNYEVTAMLEGMPSQRFMVRGHQRSLGWVPLVEAVLDGIQQSMAGPQPSVAGKDGNGE